MKLSLTVAVFLMVCSAYAQDFKTGKIKNSHFEQTLNADQVDADAVVLENNRETTFLYRDDKEGWIIITKIHKIIKIQSEKGREYGSPKVSLYNSVTKEMTIDDISAFSYNLVDGKVQKEKLRKETIYENKLDENWTEISLAIPAVRKGSIVEYFYEVTSPFMKVEDLIVQDDIPVKLYRTKISTPEFFKFNRYIKGYLPIKTKSEYYENRNENFSQDQKNPFGGRTNKTQFLNFKFSQLTSEYEIEDIPALVEEPHVNEIDNFRSTVVYELASIENNSGEDENYSRTWEDVVKQINKSKRFGVRIERTSFLDEIGDRFRESIPSQQKRIEAVFSEIQSHFVWNKKERLYTEQTLREAYKNKIGSSAEINLTLVALLRKSGLKAFPVLLSTKNNGIPIYPTLEGFNYVIVAVDVGGSFELMDATEKKTRPGLLPLRALNWQGRVVKDDGNSSLVNLFPSKHAKTQTMVKASLSVDGILTGTSNSRFIGNKALEYRKGLAILAPKSLEQKLLSQHSLESVDNISIQEKDLSRAPTLKFDFQGSGYLEEVGEKYYLNPLLFMGIQEHPFKEKTRVLPIDYEYPWIDSKVISINLDPAYEISSVPESFAYELPENVGRFTFQIQEQNGSLQVQRTMQINKTLLSPDFYIALQEFYSNILAKETEKVVLIKK